jgi:Escherichia/Staphylococcus phage prohead protease
MPDPVEIRVVEAGELRVESRGVAPVLRGYAIVYNRLSEVLGAFREQIAPEAMRRTLAEGVDLRALVDHNPEKPLGRLSAKTLRVESDAHGLRVEIDPPQTSYGHDIVESIRRGDVTGMSFAFRTMDDRWDLSATPPLRTVTDMLVREVSVVTFPAYPETEVAMRSLEAVRARAGSYPRGRTVAERQAWAAAQRR